MRDLRVARWSCGRPVRRETLDIAAAKHHDTIEALGQERAVIDPAGQFHYAHPENAARLVGADPLLWGHGAKGDTAGRYENR